MSFNSSALRLACAIALAAVVLPTPGAARGETAAVATPNDPRFPEQWGLQRIEAPTAWEITTGSPAVVVAVVDTGVDLGHPDLQGRLVDGFNVIREDRPPQDDNGHGTHMAGTIGATVNNGVGIAGVAPNISIMPVKALSRTGVGIEEPTARGIRWAADHGAWVINLSVGERVRNAEGLPFVREAIDYAVGLGAVVVIAAGNSGTGEPPELARTPGAIVVGSTMPTDARPPSSNHGPWVHIGAPGTGIISTFFDGTSTYRMQSGTSQAAAHVSGVAALMLTARPTLTPGDVAAILQATADPLPGQHLGPGRINAARAVAAARDLPSTPPVPIPPPGSVVADAGPPTMTREEAEAQQGGEPEPATGNVTAP